jgi:hypothetical protein
MKAMLTQSTQTDAEVRRVKVYPSEVTRLKAMGYRLDYNVHDHMVAEPLHDPRVMRVLAASQQLYELRKAPQWVREAASEDWWEHEYQKALASLPRARSRVVVEFNEHCSAGTAVAQLDIQKPEWDEDHWEPVEFRQLSLEELAHGSPRYMEHVRTMLYARARAQGLSI